MRNLKLFFFLFGLGLVFLALAVGGVFLHLKPELLTQKIYYEVGEVISIKGEAKRLSPKAGPLSSFDKVYSDESFFLPEDAELILRLSNEKLKIFGPCEFNLKVFSPEKQQVFLNFEVFGGVKEMEPLKQVFLTYKGWSIQPYFTVADIESGNYQKIDLSIEKNKALPSSEDKTLILDELIGAKRPLLQRCYENYLRSNPQAYGKLFVEFILQTTGKVSSSTIKESSFFKDEKFKLCIQDVFTRIKTSPFSGEALHVTYPIEFEN